MKSKKILAVLMAAGMTLSLAACGSSSDSTDKSADNGSDSGKTSVSYTHLTLPTKLEV